VIITVTCPHCNKRFRAFEPEDTDDLTACPFCGTEFPIFFGRLLSLREAMGKSEPSAIERVSAVADDGLRAHLVAHDAMMETLDSLLGQHEEGQR